MSMRSEITSSKVKGQKSVFEMERLAQYFQEMKQPQTLKEITDGIGTPLSSSEVEDMLKKMQKRGEISCKEINQDQNHHNDDPIKLYWRARPYPSSGRTPNHNHQTSNVFTTPTSCMKPPSMRSRLPFKSPAKISTPHHTPHSDGSPSLNHTNSVPLLTPNEIEDDIAYLQTKLESAEREIEELSKDHHERELQSHIDALHEYNEMKDIGQILLGKIAEQEGTTTASLYERFGLDVDN